jgi:hypothetical protein
MSRASVFSKRGACWAIAGLVGAVGGGLTAQLSISRLAPEAPAPTYLAAPPVAEATADEVHRFCGHCHAYPPPDSFPRTAWRKEVKTGYDFYWKSQLRLEVPSMESVALYYERRAPDTLPLVTHRAPTSEPPIRFTRVGYAPPKCDSFPGVTHVSMVKLFDPKKREVLVCDAHSGQVMALQAHADLARWQVLGQLLAPAHAEVVDLDGDNRPDILVADLGKVQASDAKCGQVVWLRGRADGTFTPIPLLEGVGRVADVQAADFRGHGKLDLVAAVFGWNDTGEILYLENCTQDWEKPVFVPHVLDERHGAIHTCVVDLDGDGKPDIVALISQQHESIVAFMNRGGGNFTKKTLFEGPHPAYGSSGIQLVDLNGDGKPDILYTNGDSLDPPAILKPYHAVQWLENLGDGTFKPHTITPMYGVMRAVAADFRGPGKRDVVAVSFLGPRGYSQRTKLNLASVVFLEDLGQGEYLRHSLETGTCDHFTCCVGDLHGDGRMHLVTGNFTYSRQDPIADAVVIWSPNAP